MNNNSRLYSFFKTEKGYVADVGGKKTFLDRNSVKPEGNKRYECVITKEFEKYQFCKIIKLHNDIVIKEYDYSFKVKSQNYNINSELYIYAIIHNRDVAIKVVKEITKAGYRKRLIAWLKMSKRAIVEEVALKKIKEETGIYIINDRNISVFRENFEWIIKYTLYDKEKEEYNERLSKISQKIIKKYQKKKDKILYKEFIIDLRNNDKKFKNCKELTDMVDRKMFYVSQPSVKIKKYGMTLSFKRVYAYDTEPLDQIIHDLRKIRYCDFREKYCDKDHNIVHGDFIITRINKSTYSYTNQISEKERYGTTYEPIIKRCKVMLYYKCYDVDYYQFKKDTKIEKSFTYKIYKK